jgi:ribonuclease HI
MTVFCDGSGWNGRVCRYAIASECGHLEVHELEDQFTSNQLEYMAVIRAIEWVSEEELPEATVATDSMLVINQVSGRWKIRKPHLFTLAMKVRNLLKDRQNVKLIHVPRTENLAGHLL